jgi:hypothetical protein
MSFAKIFAMSFASCNWVKPCKGRGPRLTPQHVGAAPSRAHRGWPVAELRAGSQRRLGECWTAKACGARLTQLSTDPGPARRAALAGARPPPAAGDQGRLFRSLIVWASIGGTRGGFERQIDGLAGRPEAGAKPPRVCAGRRCASFGVPADRPRAFACGRASPAN